MLLKFQIGLETEVSLTKQRYEQHISNCEKILLLRKNMKIFTGYAAVHTALLLRAQIV